MVDTAQTSTDPPQERIPFSDDIGSAAFETSRNWKDVEWSAAMWRQPDDTAPVVDSRTPELRAKPSLVSRLKTLHPTVPQKLELLILVTVIIIVASLLFVPGTLDLGNWGYPGAFVINALSTATLILPAPGIALILSMANDLNPIGLGIASGLGGAIGSLTAYWAGAQGRQALEGKRFYKFMLSYMERFGGAALFLFSALAILPGDIASVVAGATRYPLKRYMLYVGAGNVVKMVLILYVMTKYFGWAADWLGRFM